MSNYLTPETTTKLADHAVDALCLCGIVAAIYLGGATNPVIGGIVSIALGKRIIKQ